MNTCWQVLGRVACSKKSEVKQDLLVLLHR